jgi:hypothetical protein
MRTRGFEAMVVLSVGMKKASEGVFLYSSRERTGIKDLPKRRTRHGALPFPISVRKEKEDETGI